MLSNIRRTIKNAFYVKGYYEAPPDSFPSRAGCQSTDMFRVPVNKSEAANGVSLADFQAAFLLSPLFQLELWILSKLMPTETLTRERLIAVARGEETRFAGWRNLAAEGDRQRAITTATEPTAVCQIMRCQINEKPFCDTWWAVERSQDETELVFGTAIIFSGRKPLALSILDPVHRIYSRMLLASAKATLTGQIRPSKAK